MGAIEIIRNILEDIKDEEYDLGHDDQMFLETILDGTLAPSDSGVARLNKIIRDYKDATQ